MYFLCNISTLPRISCMNSYRAGSSWTHFRRQCDEYILYYLTEGQMYLREDGTDYTLKKGDVFLLQPGLVHEGTKPAACAYYYVHFKNLSILPQADEDMLFPGRNMASRFNSLDFQSAGLYQDELQYDMAYCMLPKHLQTGNEKTTQQLAGQFDAMIEKARSRVKNYKIFNSCQLLQIMMEISSHCTSFPPGKGNNRIAPRTMQKIEELTDYLENHYKEKITGTQVGNLLDMNFDYINRVFRKIMGEPIFQYLNRIRINHARELLMTTDMKLVGIAMETGFSDEFYLSRQFKKYMGVSPAAYVKNQIQYRHVAQVQYKSV